MTTARDLAGISGVNRVAVRATDDSADALRRVADDLRTRFATDEVTFTDMPVSIPDGIHPIEGDIDQVSTLIGFLGIVAGLVALVLLGSTTTTLITERTREVAVMRALGARNREVRRRLRRLAVGIAAVAVVVGVPLGIADLQRDRTTGAPGVRRDHAGDRGVDTCRRWPAPCSRWSGPASSPAARHVG